MQAPARAVDLGADLYRLWRARHVREGRDWLERALLAGGPDVTPAVRASGLFAAAWLAHFQGDYAAQRRMADECLAAAQVGRRAAHPGARALRRPGRAARRRPGGGRGVLPREPGPLRAPRRRHRRCHRQQRPRRDRPRAWGARRGAGALRASAGAMAGDGRCDGRRARRPQPGSGGARCRRPSARRRPPARVAGGERRDGRPQSARRRRWPRSSPWPPSASRAPPPPRSTARRRRRWRPPGSCSTPSTLRRSRGPTRC